MSGFDFTKDLSESYQDATENNGTKLAGAIGDTDDDTVAVMGAAEPSFKNCKMKKFLSAVEAKGMSLCGDLVMTKGDIFMKDGTNLEAVVKNIEIVYGEKYGDSSTGFHFVNMDPSGLGLTEAIADADHQTLSPDGNPSSEPDQTVMGDEADPSSTRASAQFGGTVGYFLRITRPGGAHEYLELAPLNTLLDGLGTDGSIVSLLGVLNEVEDAQELIKAALDDERIARIADVEQLEAQFGRDAQTFVAFLQDLEAQIAALVPAAVSHVESRITKVSTALEEQHAADRMHAELTVTDEMLQVGDEVCEGLAFEFLSEEIQGVELDKANRQDISKWMISVELESKDSADTESVRLRRQDFDIAFEASMVDGQIKINGLLEACDDLLDGEDTNNYFLVANAIWCGAGDDIEGQADLGEFSSSMPTPLGQSLSFTDEDADLTGEPRKVTYTQSS